MRTEDAPALLHEYLEAVNRLGDARRRVPVRRALIVGSEREAALARLAFAHADGGNRRNGEGYARHAGVLGRALVSIQEIRRNHTRFVSRHRRERRTFLRAIARRVDGGIRYALQILIQLELS